MSSKTGRNRVVAALGVDKIAEDLLNAGLDGSRSYSRTLRRVRSINWSMFVGLVTCTIFAAYYAWIDVPLLVGITLLGLLGSLATIVFLRRTLRVDLAGHLATSVVFVLIVAGGWLAGGYAGGLFNWIFIVPVAALLMNGSRSAWIWIGATLGVVVLASRLQDLGFEAPSVIPNDVWDQHTLVGRVGALACAAALLALIFRDQRHAERAIRNLAFRDAVTGLANRQSFQQVFERALDRARRTHGHLALMLIDLDRFKSINDTLGHEVGDLVLCRVAEGFTENVRYDDLVTRRLANSGGTISRLGGDEFTIVLTDIRSETDASLTAQRLLDFLNEPMKVDGLELFTTASIGISIFPQDGTEASTLVRRADAAMYNAKQRGGNTFEFYSESMNDDSVRRIFMENRLRKAIEHNELRLFYQPLYCAETTRIMAVEALVRWDSPSMGWVSPAEFVPVAEDTGLIVQVGDWVLAEACRQWLEWQAMGLPKIRMSVNCSAVQLKRVDSVEAILETVQRQNMEKEWLELEITESVLVRDDDPIVAELDRLRQAGISLALDDFGTGYSSLNYLRSLPIERLKIDRDFVSAVVANPQEATLTRAIVDLAQGLGLKVIAEGVETREQLDFLRQLGCDEIQGFLLSRPRPGHEVAELLKEEQEVRERTPAAAIPFAVS